MLEGRQQLIIALAAVAIFLDHGDNILLEALAFKEHEETAGQFIVGSDGEGAGRAGELVGGRVELKSRVHGAKIGEWSRSVY